MLVLSRRSGEAVIIGDEIHMKVVAVDEASGYATIGIDAPLAVEVHREEVYNRINDRKPGVVVTHKRRFRALVPESKH